MWNLEKRIRLTSQTVHRYGKTQMVEGTYRGIDKMLERIEELLLYRV
jgi:hypothetical protein